MKPSILRNGRLVYGPILLLLAVLGLCVFLGTVPAHGDGGPTCNDSDGGLTYDVAGHVEGVGATGYSYWRDDTCLADDLGGYVKEWYCGGTTALPKSYACPYGCDAGACLGLPTGCTDADGDGYALEGGDCGPVDCDDADPAVHPGTAEVCDNGLDDNCNGLADAADPGCTPCVDSDGGLDYEVAGYVAGTGPNGGLGYVKEYYCSGDTPLPQAHACPYGCDGGACLGLPASCTDADGDGYAVEGGDCGPIDCDDARPAVHPGAAEACDNGLDDDCNGLADAADPGCTPCVDSDGGLDYEVAGYVAGTGPNGGL
ncbi:MAG: putative metal-binding motif-containing protein, partial [Anaerolineae bacterium]